MIGRHSDAPPRTPERQRVAAAIERYADATTNAERVATAQRRAEDAFFEVLQPAVSAAREALEDARAAQPQALVAAAFGEEASDTPSVADAEKAVVDAERKLTASRRARSILDDEARRAEAALGMARFNLDNAVAAAVAADAAVAAIKAEFLATGRRMLRCAQILRTAGIHMRGVDGAGLRANVGEAPAAVGEQAFRPDADWVQAISLLASDPEAPLPALPEQDPDDAGDGDRAAAA